MTLRKVFSYISGTSWNGVMIRGGKDEYVQIVQLQTNDMIMLGTGQT